MNNERYSTNTIQCNSQRDAIHPDEEDQRNKNIDDRIGTCRLEEEKKTSEYQMLPEKIAKQIKESVRSFPEYHDMVTILICNLIISDLHGFSAIDSISIINKILTRFDELTVKNNVYQMRSTNNAYMAVGGIPNRDDLHADRIANQAIDMVLSANQLLKSDSGLPLKIRVGIHSGAAMSGVVGVHMPRYCLFGDTLTTASLIEAQGLPGQIHISQDTYEILKTRGYQFTCRGVSIASTTANSRVTYFLVGGVNSPIEFLGGESIPGDQLSINGFDTCPSVFCGIQ